LNESKSIHYVRKAVNNSKRCDTFLNIEYDAFLSRFWKSAILGLAKGIDQDYRSLAWKISCLKARIQERVNALRMTCLDEERLDNALHQVKAFIIIIFCSCSFVFKKKKFLGKRG